MFKERIANCESPERVTGHRKAVKAQRSPAVKPPVHRAFPYITQRSSPASYVTLNACSETQNMMFPEQGPHSHRLFLWFSTRGDFTPQGTFGNVWKH
jgi:hypothetical protein